jgi:hypothetical protein
MIEILKNTQTRKSRASGGTSKRKRKNDEKGKMVYTKL